MGLLLLVLVLFTWCAGSQRVTVGNDLWVPGLGSFRIEEVDASCPGGSVMVAWKVRGDRYKKLKAKMEVYSASGDLMGRYKDWIGPRSGITRVTLRDCKEGDVPSRIKIKQVYIDLDGGCH